MTASRLFSLFWSAPIVVQAWVVSALLLVALGVWTASLGAGHAAGRLVDRRNTRRESRVNAPVDPFVRVLGLPPAEVEREFDAIVEASAGDAEAAR